MSEIKFLLDENLPYKLLDFLISEGYECFHIKKLGKAGIKNGEVYKLGADLKSFLITRDKDFQNFSRFLSSDIRGVILLKISKTDTANIIAKVKEFAGKLKEIDICGSIVIIEDDKITVTKKE